MAQFGHVILGLATMTMLWSLIGLPIAARVATRELSLFIAPAMGWAVFSAASLPLFVLVGMSRPIVFAVLLVVMAGSLAALGHWRRKLDHAVLSKLTVAAMGAAALLALIPLLAILPKESADGIRLAAPIFDHSKIAMIDEMARAGVPAANPFFHEIGAPQRLSYYYLWHFSAAVIAVMTGISGWEADAALTWFTAFSSLLVVVGFAIWLSGRASAGLFAVAVAATGSLRPVAEWIFGKEPTQSAIGWGTGFGGWLFQTSWAPQHVASAMTVVLACYLIAQLPTRRDPLFLITLGLIAAAGFQSSVWVGGFAFAIAAAAIGLKILWQLPPPSRLPFLARAALSALFATALAALFLYDQLTITAMRDGGVPLAIEPLPVLGDAFPASIRRFIDVPAYWLIYLPVELPAFYAAGLIALFLLLRDRAVVGKHRRATLQALALLLIGSLVCSWLLIGDLGGNNDLAWRSALPAILLLIAFAAVGLAQWIATGQRILPSLALVGVLIGLPEAVDLARDYAAGKQNGSEQSFAKSPALWTAVRRHSSATERIANNPLFASAMTPWPINISWALLSDRRSCYAGYDLGIPFAPVSAARRTMIDEQFLRVFDGRPASDDLQQLAERYGCDVAVVTAEDGAWSRDPFASSGRYRLVESQAGEWRIYRKAGP